MFDELEKIWIEEIFNEKIEEVKRGMEQFPFNSAYENDYIALTKALEKIRKLF